MPNRIIRDWTDSKAIDALSAEAEVLFTRLIMKADDFGKYYADPVLLRSLLFPRKEKLTGDLIKIWLAEVVREKLVTIYQTPNGDQFLKIDKFNQRLRQMRSNFPEPPNSNDGQVTATRGQVADNRPPEGREGNEVETKRGRGQMPPPARDDIFNIFKTLIPKLDPGYDIKIKTAEEKAFEKYKTRKASLNGSATPEEKKKIKAEYEAQALNLGKQRGKIIGDMSDLFFTHYESTGWNDKHGQAITNVEATAEKWIHREKTFTKK